LGTGSRNLALFFGILFLFGGQPVRPAVFPTLATPPARTSHKKKHVKVWVNTQTGIYHCPRTRWYGKTNHGKYMDECEARKAGYRPAYYRPCGSECTE
jgi:hypothetical protein